MIVAGHNRGINNRISVRKKTTVLFDKMGEGPQDFLKMCDEVGIFNFTPTGTA